MFGIVSGRDRGDDVFRRRVALHGPVVSAVSRGHLAPVSQLAYVVPRTPTFREALTMDTSPLSPEQFRGRFPVFEPPRLRELLLSGRAVDRCRGRPCTSGSHSWHAHGSPWERWVEAGGGAARAICRLDRRRPRRDCRPAQRLGAASTRSPARSTSRGPRSAGRRWASSSSRRWRRPGWRSERRGARRHGGRGRRAICLAVQRV